jgi:hypothetical protein
VFRGEPFAERAAVASEVGGHGGNVGAAV